MDKVFSNYVRDENNMKQGTRNDTLFAVMKWLLIELNICHALNTE